MRMTQITYHVGLGTTYIDGLTLRCLDQGMSPCNTQFKGSRYGTLGH